MCDKLRRVTVSPSAIAQRSRSAAVLGGPASSNVLIVTSCIQWAVGSGRWADGGWWQVSSTAYRLPPTAHRLTDRHLVRRRVGRVAREAEEDFVQGRAAQA